MLRTFLILGSTVAGAIGCDDARGSDMVTPQIEQCREISDDAERLSCYDSIGAPILVADTDATEVAEDYGLSDTADESEIYAVGIDRCGMASNRYFYFYLENGQIWKYIGSKKLKYRRCPSAAEITEDRLGHKLRLQGETRWHRVLRKK